MIKIRQLKFWQHLLIYLFCIFIIAGILFYTLTLIYPVKKRAPVYKVYFSKIIIYILKHTNKNMVYRINLSDFLDIFISNLLGVFSIFFVLTFYVIHKIRENPWKRIYYLFPVATLYLAITIYFARAYWLTYNIYPIDKSSTLVFFWGVIIFHGILEEGVWIILSFYFVNIFLYLYNNADQSKDNLIQELRERFQKLKKSIPWIIFILLISATIESLDLGAYFK